MATRLYDYCSTIRELKFVDFLLTLTETKGFWDKVRKRCSRVSSDYFIGRYQCLAEARYVELGGTL